MMLDKHTHRANAIAAMRAVVACDWAKVVLSCELQKQPKESTSADDHAVAVELLKLQVEDELSKCFEALSAYYHNPNVRTT